MRTLFLVTLLLSSLPATGEMPEPRWLTLNHAAHEAKERKDYAKLRAALTELWPLLPWNGRILYTMAAADALLGHRENALAELTNLAAAGLVHDLASDDDLQSLRGSPQ